MILLIQLANNRVSCSVYVIDLMKGYHQIKMHLDYKNKTAFTYHMGLYQYCHLLFEAPATFMKQLFSGNFVYVYLRIVPKTFQEHLQHVDKVMTQLSEAGLRFKPSR